MRKVGKYVAAVAEYERSAQRHDLDLNKSDLDSIDIKELGLELRLSSSGHGKLLGQVFSTAKKGRAAGKLLVPVPQPTSILQFKN